MKDFTILNALCSITILLPHWNLIFHTSNIFPSKLPDNNIKLALVTIGDKVRHSMCTSPISIYLYYFKHILTMVCINHLNVVFIFNVQFITTTKSFFSLGVAWLYHLLFIYVQKKHTVMSNNQLVWKNRKSSYTEEFLWFEYRKCWNVPGKL